MCRSLINRQGLKSTFEKVLSLPLDGQFNAVGVCMTYQSLASLPRALLNRLRSYRLAIVLDEITTVARINLRQRLGQIPFWR